MAERTKGKEVLSDIVAGTRRLISRLREDVDELSTKGRFKLEIISLKNRRARVFRELGMRVYVLIKNRKREIPEAKSLVAEIGRLDAEIKIQEKALNDFLSAGGSKAGSRQLRAASADGRAGQTRKGYKREKTAGE